MISYVGIIHILQKLTKNEKIGPTVQESMKGGLVTGLTTLVGGLAFGVMGIVVGSSAGGILAYACSKDFKSIPTIIGELSSEEQQELVQYLMQCLNISDINILFTFISNPEYSQKVIKIVEQFLKEHYSRET